MGARAEDGGIRRPVPRLHTDPGGTPYFDEDLQVGQLKPHRIMTSETTPILAALADEVGILFLADEPIWYLHPETDEQKVFFGDMVLARPVDHMRITSSDLLLVIEVVSTNDRRKELKDTRFQRLLNEYNGVPEFALVFPDVEDPRALTWFRIVGDEYVEEVIAPGASACSSMVPGLEMRVRPREEWAPGYKIDVVYRGELRPRLAVERVRAEREKARAEREKARAEREKAQAEQEKARADQEKARAEQEKAQAEREKARADQEKVRADQEKARADALEARLRELGLDDPNTRNEPD
jgi:Uma2 family endonuclease